MLGIYHAGELGVRARPGVQEKAQMDLLSFRRGYLQETTLEHGRLLAEDLDAVV